MKNIKESANFIWSIADLLRGDYKQSDYGKIILRLTGIRRVDCVLNKTKEAVLQKHQAVRAMNIQNLDPILNKVAGYNFHNSSLFDFDKLIADPNNIAANLRNYINGFSEDVYGTITNKYIDPVVLTTSSYVKKTIANDKVMQYTIEIEKSKMKRTQAV